MDKLQAEAVVQAMLTPDRAAQEEIQHKKVAAARKLAEQRLVAKLGLFGCAVGVVVTYFIGWRLASGVIWGGITGAVTGWAFVFWRRALTIYSFKRTPYRRRLTQA